ncbi:MAG: hypothetical protein R3E12_11030 [Candidatus Eisenbacteria bacterium]
MIEELPGGVVDAVLVARRAAQRSLAGQGREIGVPQLELDGPADDAIATEATGDPHRLVEQDRVEQLRLFLIAGEGLLVAVGLASQSGTTSRSSRP